MHGSVCNVPPGMLTFSPFPWRAHILSLPGVLTFSPFPWRAHILSPPHSLKKNKNKTEDAHRSLDKRVSALTDSLEALRKEVSFLGEARASLLPVPIPFIVQVLHSADGLEKLYGEVQEVASAVSNMSTGLQAISLEVRGHSQH